MNKLQGAVAFEAISNQLRNELTPDFPFEEPCFGRLSEALLARAHNRVDQPSELDLAILIRQALRFYKFRSGSLSPRLWIRSGRGWPEADHWRRVGIESREQDGGYMVQARPWIPDWLPNSHPEGTDAGAASETFKRLSDIVSGDPFMQISAGHRSYLTRGQRSAVRAALRTPPGATLLVCLPTGDGKSYVFQAISEMGYERNHALRGVTVVVTPTVALALDHQRSAEQMGIAGHRLAYVGGMPNEERNELISRIKSGTQGLCFAGPEAVCGPLRTALKEAAEAGLLNAVVIDEAHLVDAWGSNFRPTFQVLSGLMKELLETAPLAYRPRTILLSATLTNSTVETLRKLFLGYLPDDSGFRLVSAAQLRPEIEYWVSEPTSEIERRERVLETLAHMPRPAILYVTEVSHAERWYKALREYGFRRLGLMTGSTSGERRRQVVEDWREQRLDIVVGTSAFGLGIDNPNVRTVIHACIPETLDRFYQEVGRGGRSGHSSASIIIPVSEQGRNWRDDFSMARGLNQRRLLTVEVAHQRWSAMFNRQDSIYEGNGTFRLRVDGRPGMGEGYIDMEGETNTEWNVRTLTLMANAGMIELLGPQSQLSDSLNSEPLNIETESVEATVSRDLEQFQRVKIIEPMHLDSEVWESVVGPHREKMGAAHRQNLRQMLRFLETKECAAKTLAPIYQLEMHTEDGESPCILPVASACGGCPFCRSRGSIREPETPRTPQYPWTPEAVAQPASQLLDFSNRLVVYYENDISRRVLRRWTEALAKLANCGVRNFIALPGSPIELVDVQRLLRGTAIFASERLPPRDALPPGPVTILVPPGMPVTDYLLRPRKPFEAHFIFVHRNTEYPGMPGLSLLSRFEGPQFAQLDHFIERVNR